CSIAPTAHISTATGTAKPSCLNTMPPPARQPAPGNARGPLFAQARRERPPGRAKKAAEENRKRTQQCRKYDIIDYGSTPDPHTPPPREDPDDPPPDRTHQRDDR